MAISPSLSCLFLMLISLSFAATSIKAKSLIPEVCAKTKNPSFCNKVLGSNPKAATSDLKGLGYISINLALPTAKQTFGYVSSLLKKTTDQTLKARFDDCVENYDLTVDSLNKCKTYLEKGDIASFRNLASSALTGINTCQDTFEDPPAAPAQLNALNTKSAALVGIVLSVSANL